MTKLEALRSLEELFLNSDRNVGTLAAYYGLREFIVNSSDKKEEVDKTPILLKIQRS